MARLAIQDSREGSRARWRFILAVCTPGVLNDSKDLISLQLNAGRLPLGPRIAACCLCTAAMCLWLS